MLNLKIVELLGGLGNQMFQFSLYYKFMSMGFDAKVDISNLVNYGLHNGYELEDIFGVNPNYATPTEVRRYSRYNSLTLINKFNNKFRSPKRFEFIERKPFIYDSTVFSETSMVYYKGYWQNENYFFEIRNDLIKQFSFKVPLAGNNLNALKLIQDCESVSLHIRRGDYLLDSQRSAVCDLEYYASAVKYITEIIPNVVFFIFSDDISRCKNNLKIDNAHFIDWNVGIHSYIDMQLMSYCKHNVIANSTFSWWGAWLNINPNKVVICPKKWIYRNSEEDIIPPDWIKL